MVEIKHITQVLLTNEEVISYGKNLLEYICFQHEERKRNGISEEDLLCEEEALRILIGNFERELERY